MSVENKAINKPEQKAEQKSELRRIVRFMETDLDGAMQLSKALRKVRGISFMFANAVCITTGLDPKRKISTFSPEELKALEGAIRNPAFPAWMLNRRKDMETGGNVHLLGTGLQFAQREDINAMKRMRIYKGVRHELGQPVRGQRTRSSFRTNKTIGVSKKKLEPAKAGAPKAASAPAAAAKKK